MFGADKEADLKKQLADAQAENIALRKTIEEVKAHEVRALQTWVAAFNGAVQQCLGPQPETPAPKPVEATK